MSELVSIVLKEKKKQKKAPPQHDKRYLCDVLTCSELLNSHEREADEREGFTQNLLFVLRGRGKLLSVTLGLRPAYHRPEQAVLPDAECVSLQHCT